MRVDAMSVGFERTSEPRATQYMPAFVRARLCVEGRFSPCSCFGLLLYVYPILTWGSVALAPSLFFFFLGPVNEKPS